VAAPGEREKVRFVSGGGECAAWHYPGTNGACVLMAGGLGVTKEPATDRLAARFSEAGFSVLAFDFRRLGESDGFPRQIAGIKEQQGDWRAALAYARTLPGVDPSRIAIWGFSLSGGHVFEVASREPTLAAAIAHAPLADGPAATPNALRHQTIAAGLRLTARAILDALGAAFGRPPLLVPLVAPEGEVASISTPDSLNGERALNPENRYPDWQKQIAARSALRIGFYRPARRASEIRCPLLVLAQEHDGVAPPGPAIRAGKRAPRGEVEILPGGHYAAFLDQHEQAVAVMLDFLDRHLLADGRAAAPTHDHAPRREAPVR
jgi:uncharacterized protein